MSKKEKQEPILISIVGQPRSGKNHFLYGLLSSIQKLRGSLDSSATLFFDKYFFQEIHSANYYASMETEFLTSGIKHTSKVKFGVDEDSRLPVFTATIFDQSFHFINVPGGFFTDDENILRNLITEKKMKICWTALKSLNDETNTDKQKHADLIVNEIKIIHDYIKKNMSSIDISASEYFLSYLFFKNSDFAYNLYNGENEEWTKAKILIPEKTLYILTKADLKEDENYNNFFKDIYIKNDYEENISSHYHNLFKVICDRSSNLIDEKISSDFDILPVLFYVFVFNNETIVLNGKELYKDKDTFEGSFNFNSDSIRTSFRDYIKDFNTANEKFKKKLLPCLKGLGYDIALLYMIKNLLNQSNTKIVTESSIINNVIRKFIKEKYKNEQLKSLIKTFVEIQDN